MSYDSRPLTTSEKAIVALPMITSELKTVTAILHTIRTNPEIDLTLVCMRNSTGDSAFERPQMKTVQLRISPEYYNLLYSFLVQIEGDLKNAAQTRVSEL